jgi:hypothetical protein
MLLDHLSGGLTLFAEKSQQCPVDFFAVRS